MLFFVSYNLFFFFNVINLVGQKIELAWKINLIKKCIFREVLLLKQLKKT